MAAIRIDSIIRKLKNLKDLHPNLNSFGVGTTSDIQGQIDNYPYLFVIMNNTHSMLEVDNTYSVVEYTFTLRIGDKVNDQTGYDHEVGIGSYNGLDIISDTFNTLLDIINTIKNNINGEFSDVVLSDDIQIESFFDEDDNIVNGNEAVITLRVLNDDTCINPMFD